MKRLIIPGFACPAHAWEKYLDHSRVISLSEILSHTKTSDYKDWYRYVAEEIIKFQPGSIICHDFGGVSTFLALLRLKKKGQLPKCRLTILNTAFRGFDVFKNTHPFRMIGVTWENLQENMPKAKGELDPLLKPLLPYVKQAYGKLIFNSFIQKAQNMFRKMRPYHLDLGIPVQFICSPTDRFIHPSTLELLRRDFKIDHYVEIPYGHFPYSSENAQKVKEIILAFENQN